jgi:hypothetical protein
VHPSSADMPVGRLVLDEVRLFPAPHQPPILCPVPRPVPVATDGQNGGTEHCACKGLKVVRLLATAREHLLRVEVRAFSGGRASARSAAP